MERGIKRKLTETPSFAGGGVFTATRKQFVKPTGFKMRKGLNYMGLYKHLPQRLYPFVDRTEFLIQLAANNGAGGGVSSQTPGAFSSTAGGPSGVAGNGFAMTFALQGTFFTNSAGTTQYQNYQYTEYSNLFDQYRIDQIELDMMFNSNTTTAVPINTNGFPVIFLVEDLDDATPPATNTLFQYSSCKTIQFGNSSGDTNGHQYYKIVPAVPIIAQNTSGASVVTWNKKHCWCDSDNANIAHFGVKGWYDNPQQSGVVAGAVQGYITVVVKTKFVCKMTK